jgi:hypothetical protein
LARTDFNVWSPPVAVAVHLGAPLDFGPLLQAFEAAHPHLVPFGAPHAWHAADAMGPEKRQLYRAITEEVRAAVLASHARALSEQATSTKAQ